MNEKWHITDSDGETIIILKEIHKVADYERILREERIEYKTDYYIDNKLITKR